MSWRAVRYELEDDQMLTTMMLILTAQVSCDPGYTEAPSDMEILRAMMPPQKTLFVVEDNRVDIVIVKSRLATQKLLVPLPAGEWLTIEKTHWECVVYYTELLHWDFPFPFPFYAKKQHVQVVYFDKVGHLAKPTGEVTRY
jgi:hypothetical protein